MPLLTVMPRAAPMNTARSDCICAPMQNTNANISSLDAASSPSINTGVHASETKHHARKIPPSRCPSVNLIVPRKIKNNGAAIATSDQRGAIAAPEAPGQNRIVNRKLASPAGISEYRSTRCRRSTMSCARRSKARQSRSAMSRASD